MQPMLADHPLEGAQVEGPARLRGVVRARKRTVVVRSTINIGSAVRPSRAGRPAWSIVADTCSILVRTTPDRTTPDLDSGASAHHLSSPLPPPACWYPPHDARHRRLGVASRSSRLGAVATVAVTAIAILSLTAFLWLRIDLPSEGATVPSDAWTWTSSGGRRRPGRHRHPVPGGRPGRGHRRHPARDVGGPDVRWRHGSGCRHGSPGDDRDPRRGPRSASTRRSERFRWPPALASSWALVAFTLAQLTLATWLLVRRPTNLAIRILFVGSVANLASRSRGNTSASSPATSCAAGRTWSRSWPADRSTSSSGRACCTSSSSIRRAARSWPAMAGSPPPCT